jgi:hypothetical protein
VRKTENERFHRSRLAVLKCRKLQYLRRHGPFKWGSKIALMLLSKDRDSAPPAEASACALSTSGVPEQSLFHWPPAKRPALLTQVPAEEHRLTNIIQFRRRPPQRRRLLIAKCKVCMAHFTQAAPNHYLCLDCYWWDAALTAQAAMAQAFHELRAGGHR